MAVGPDLIDVMVTLLGNQFWFWYKIIFQILFEQMINFVGVLFIKG